ncbi:MAG: toxin-antitoxin system HicB family antitoxin [Deltaproteobacteria bacterium]|nr:MAG: toxin-antitoxin system HicB family antitoxin [Deltaproteobacteria bacterium]TMQ16357.1 MAG: toxin-antitoxin system HicB family antitoxin [Deltaproteobacteria bacterium]
MTTLSLRLPESLHLRLAEVAEREGVSINQLISSAVAEKMSALLTEEYLSTRAHRATRSRFLAALAEVPDREPAPSDRRVPRHDRRVAARGAAADVPARHARRRRTRG